MLVQCLNFIAIMSIELFDKQLISPQIKQYLNMSLFYLILPPIFDQCILTRRRSDFILLFKYFYNIQFKPKHISDLQLSMQKNKYLRFRPTFESPLVHRNCYYDISNSDLCVWRLPELELVNCYPKVSEAYYIKLRMISDDYMVIAQNETLKLFNLKEGKVVDKAQDKDFIDYIETEPTLGVIATVMTGPDQFSKTVTKWTLQNNSIRKIGSVDVRYESDITEDIFALNVFQSGKIYIYKKGFDKIYEVVVEDNSYRKNNVPVTTSAVLEMKNQKDFALAEEGKISINDPVKGSVFGSIECQEEIFTVIVEVPDKEWLITASNKALKLWVLESKTEPKIYQKSDKILVDKIHIYNEWVIGLSTRTKSLAIWNLETQELIKHEKINRQEVQKSFRLVDNIICLVIKIFDETEESLTFHNRLELVDINTDKVIASREVKNASYQIEVETIMPVDKETIRFICSSDQGVKVKSYLFSWRPFIKEEKKDMSKIEMSKSPITKLYPYDRLLLVTPPKEKTQGYQTIKKADHATLISVHNHALKRLFNTQIEGYYNDVQLSPFDRIYAIRPHSISVFKFTKPEVIELINSVELQVLKINFVGNNIFCITSEYDHVVYDGKFELILRSEGEKQEVTNVLEVNEDQFVIVNDQETIELWNLKKEEVKKLKSGFEIVGLAFEGDDKLLVTRSDRIERLDMAD